MLTREKTSSDIIPTIPPNHQNYSEVIVEVSKLGQGLKTAFEGIAMIFDSLGVGTKTDSILKPFNSDEANDTDAVQPLSETSKSIQKNAQEAPEASSTSKSSKSSITADDITRVIVEKIKQDANNNKKIEEIVHNYGVSMISQIPNSKYEAFMAELASL